MPPTILASPILAITMLLLPPPTLVLALSITEETGSKPNFGLGLGVSTSICCVLEDVVVLVVVAVSDVVVDIMVVWTVSEVVASTSVTAVVVVWIVEELNAVSSGTTVDVMILSDSVVAVDIVVVFVLAVVLLMGRSI